MTLTLQRVTANDAAGWLSAPGPGDDKYSRGVVELATGSSEYPGAARLGVEAACRSGVGLVRWSGPDALGLWLLAARPEVVLSAGRCDAVVAGSGIASAVEDERRHEVVEGIQEGMPTVLDAGGLDLVPADGTEFGPHVVLTPHVRELARLASRLGPFEVTGLSDPDERLRVARSVVERTGATLLLKGAQTLVLDRAGLAAGVAWLVEAPTHALATAGTGDVLAGLLGGLLAIAEQRGDGVRTSPAEIAACASWVHGEAALVAARRHGSHRSPVTALEVATAVPAAIGSLLDGRVA